MCSSLVVQSRPKADNPRATLTAPVRDRHLPIDGLTSAITASQPAIWGASRDCSRGRDMGQLLAWLFQKSGPRTSERRRSADRGSRVLAGRGAGDVASHAAEDHVVERGDGPPVEVSGQAVRLEDCSLSISGAAVAGRLGAELEPGAAR